MWFDLFSLPAVSAESAASGATLMISCPKLITLLGGLGVTYKGKSVDKSLGHAMFSCAPFALDRNCRDSVAFLERIDPKVFEDHTKVMRCCQRIKTTSTAMEFLAAFTFAVQGMAVSLMGGDASDAGMFAVDDLAGKGKPEPGLMHTAVTKQKLVHWFFQYASAEISPASGGDPTITPEGYQKLLSVFASPRTFYQMFARARSTA